MSDLELVSTASSTTCEGDDAEVPPYKTAYDCSMWCFSGAAKQSIILKLPKHFLISSLKVTEKAEHELSDYTLMFNTEEDGLFKNVADFLLLHTQNLTTYQVI